MANIATVSYSIEGPMKALTEILGAVFLAIGDKENKYEEYLACKHLGFTEQELGEYRLGGEIQEEPWIDEGVLHINAEEGWGLQDFHELLKKKFPGIIIYWIVEEPGLEVFYTNDKEGKHFPERFWVDICIDGIYDEEHFKTEEEVYQWLSKKTYGEVNNSSDVKTFNSNYEGSDSSDENYIYIHQFEIID